MLGLICASNVQAEAVTSWSVAGLQLQSDAGGVEMQVENLTLPGAYQLSDISYHCPTALTLFPEHSCDQAALSLLFNDQAYQAELNTAFNWQNNHWSLELTTPNQQMSLLVDSTQPVSQLRLRDWQLQDVWQQILTIEPSPQAVLNGQLQLDVEQLRVLGDEPIEFSDLSYEYSADIISVGLGGHIQVDLDVRRSQLTFALAINSGEMLVDELYVDFAAFPVNISGEIQAQESGWYDLQVNLQNEPALSVNLATEFNQSFDWRDPEFTLQVVDSHHVNQQILSSILGIYGFAGSEMSGQFKLTARSGAQRFDQWSVDFDDYYFLNTKRKIAVESLSGTVNWQQNAAAADSLLSWQALSLAGLPIHPSQIQFNWSQDAFELLGPHQFPVFDGQIQLQSLQLNSLFSEFIDMSLHAAIEPMSLQLITEKLGWAQMSGTISGDIPGMVKKGSVISFLGALNLTVFDGAMRVENLSIERLFGVAPVIAADVRFEGFDLSLLTKTFGFGLITGKLSGVVDQLRITNWKTDRMDAQVYTVKTKGIKQTISQRAIDNISSLGGIKGAISKTFLRFFDDFRYQQIKLSCKLHNSVCEIGGLKNQDNQFVIVEGGGIPKINIVGYVRSINWEEFIDRLLNANYSN